MLIQDAVADKQQASKKRKPAAKRRTAPSETSPADELKGWRNIAGFLGMPLSTAQRWAKSGMPVQRRGRSVYARSEELNRWLDRDAGLSPAAHISEAGGDLSEDLKKALAEARRTKKIHRVK